MPREPWKHNGQLQSPDKDFELVPVLSIKLWENDKNKDGQPDYSNGNMRLYNPKLKERVDLVSLSSDNTYSCLLYTSPSPRDLGKSRMPSSA